MFRVLLLILLINSVKASDCTSKLGPSDLFVEAEKNDIRLVLQELKVQSYDGFIKDAGKIYNPELEHFTTSGDQFGRMNVTSETRLWFNLQLNDKRGTRQKVSEQEKEIEATQKNLLVLALNKELFLGTIRYKQILREQESLQKLQDVISDLLGRYQRVGFLSPEQKIEVGAVELSQRQLILRKSIIENEKKLIDRFFQKVVNSTCDVQLTISQKNEIEWPELNLTPTSNSLAQKLDTFVLKKSEYELNREEARKIPDLKIGPIWQLNRLGSQEFNIFGVGLIMPLPFFDRNQGLREVAEINIRRAKLETEFNKTQRELEFDFRKKRYDELLKQVSIAGNLSKYDDLVTEYKGLFRRGLVSIPSFLAFKRELTNLLVEVHGLEQELATHYLQLHRLYAESTEHSYLKVLNL